MLAPNRSKEPKNTPPIRGTKIINLGAEPIKAIPVRPDTCNLAVSNADCTAAPDI